MSGIYVSARGVSVDMNKLKIKNEKTVAVGNAGTNARGDVVQDGKIVKTREQLTQENYKISGNNVVKNSQKKQTVIEPDTVAVNRTEVYDDFVNATTTETLNLIPLENEPRGGLASAISKSQAISERLATQRKRI